MKSSVDFHHFATALAEHKNVTEVNKAVAVLWYAGNCEHYEDMTINEIADSLTAVGLAANINTSRLFKNLSKSKLTVKGGRKKSFRISPTKKVKLDKNFVPLLKKRKVKVSDDLLPNDIIKGAGQYLESLGYHINGTYDHGFYVACAPLCRRMVESLLVECFEYAGQISTIQTEDGNLVMLDSIIRKAKCGQHIRLPRGTASIIEKIKEVGDTAAHDRYHITTKQDIDDFKTGFRKVISQLLSLAGRNPK